jgi:hypothetical protein
LPWIPVGVRKDDWGDAGTTFDVLPLQNEIEYWFVKNYYNSNKDSNIETKILSTSTLVSLLMYQILSFFNIRIHTHVDSGSN